MDLKHRKENSMTQEELRNVFKYIVRKCDMLINNGNYEADDYTQDTVEDIAELCNHILDGDYGKLVEVKEVQEVPVSEELEYASEKYACRFSSSKYGHDKVKDSFIAGANWQKEQMMKDAKSGIGNYDNYIKFEDGTWIDLDPSEQLKPAFNVNEGDKVKVLILKEE